MSIIHHIHSDTDSDCETQTETGYVKQSRSELHQLFRKIIEIKMLLLRSLNLT